MTTIHLNPVMSKPTQKRKSLPTNYQAIIVPNTSITIGKIDGTTSNKFYIEDMAEYNSYNLSYYGPIISISEKTVVIKERYGICSKTHRLSIEAFCWRNINFNLNATEENNTRISYTI